MIKCENYLRYFKNYSDKFFQEVDLDSQYSVKLRIEHTLKVVKLMRTLAKEAGLTGEDYEIAKVIALFHDFGRFNQLKLYGHFNDRLSLNHAEESVSEMKRLNILDIAGSEYVTEDKKELIYNAILYHNKDHAEFEKIKDKRLKMFAGLIRDCDKIDIYRTVAKYYGDQSPEEFFKAMQLQKSFDVSEEVYDKIMNLEALKRDDIITLGDDIIWDFYWVISDMNFPESLKLLKEKGYFEEMFDKFVASGKFKYEGDAKELYDFIYEEFCKRVENGTL